MFERMMGGGRRLLMAIAGASLLGGLLGGCGGEGAGAGGSLSGNASTLVSDIALQVDKATLPAPDSSTTATITAQTKDASNNVLGNQTVRFSTNDAGVTLTPLPANGVTDSAGKASVKVELGSGAAARTNRTVTVTATSGSVTRTTTIQIAGTRMTITGPDTVNSGGSGDYIVKIVDAANVGVSGVEVAVAYSAGTVSPASAVTGGDGQATVRVTPTASGTLTATALGQSPTKAITVLGADTPFQITAPTANASLAVNTDHVLSIRFRPASGSAAGRAVTVSTTRGTIGGSTLVTLTTDANGDASTTIRSTASGAATLTAVVTTDPSTGASLTTTSRVSYVSRTPAKITLSPDPTSIGANAVGSTSSTSRLVAVVRDATDNPVEGARVAFSATDPSGGRIDPGIAVTDADGQATASFVAGPNSTGPDAVLIRATVADAPTIFAEQRMTVSAVALFVELGTGNRIESVDTTTYRMPWSAIVTDANRNPVKDARVTVSLQAISYYKGIWVASDDGWFTARYDDITRPPAGCLSEDLPQGALKPNNLLDAGEDKDGDGKLDPGSPASVFVDASAGTTGADGRATLSVVYPKSFGQWVDVTMRVTIATAGTESSVYRTFLLPVLSEDVNNPDTAPPNVGARLPETLTLPPNTPARALVGPYGYDPTRDANGFCTNPN